MTFIETHSTGQARCLPDVALVINFEMFFRCLTTQVNGEPEEDDSHSGIQVL